MDRTVYLKISGKEYPMRFSLGAAMKISEKYGSLNQMADALTDAKTEKALETVVDVTELLVNQGCAYKNFFEKDMPIPENAPVVDGKYTGLTKGEICLAVAFTDIPILRTKIMQTIAGGEKTTIAVSKGNKEKNAETT